MQFISTDDAISKHTKWCRDTGFNEGIDCSINFIKSQKVIYDAIDPKGIQGILLGSIASTLEHFKRSTEEKGVTV